MLRFEAPAPAAESRIRVDRAACSNALADDAAALIARARGGRSDHRAGQGRVRRTCSRSDAAPRSCKRDVQFLTRADDPGHVYYLDIRGRGVFLRASPIDVSDIIREMLLDRMTATVLTSATLSVDGRFDYVRGRLGRPPGARSAAALGVRLHAAGDPLPAEEDARPAVAGVRRARPAREVVEILKRTRGRAFVLFTSYANLRAGPPARVAAEIDYPILVQGTRAAVGAAARVQGDAERRAASPPPASGRASTSSARR